MINRVFNTPKEQAEVENIINFHIHKLDYPESYKYLPQFLSLKRLLVKGIAYHHSGLIPVFKEIIEVVLILLRIHHAHQYMQVLTRRCLL